MTIQERWEKTGLLNKVPETYKNILAKAFQSQHEFNEGREISSFFKTISVPLARRVLPGLEYKVEQRPKNCLFEDTNLNIYIPTGVMFSEGKKDLNQFAHYVAESASVIRKVIIDWTYENGMMNFVAFGLVNNEIVIYTEKYYW